MGQRYFNPTGIFWLNLFQTINKHNEMEPKLLIEVSHQLASIKFSV